MSSYHGEVIVRLVGIGTPAETVVVDRADPCTMATRELVTEWLTGGGTHVVVDGPRVTFGTEGEGQGRVTYVMDLEGFRHKAEQVHLIREDVPS